MNVDLQDFNFYDEVLDHGHLWSDGWYVYSRGEVSGPFPAKHVFAFKKPDSKEAAISVSRKGLSRWYELETLKEFYHSSEASETEARKPGGSGLAVQTAQVVGKEIEKAGPQVKSSNRSAVQLIKQSQTSMPTGENQEAQPTGRTNVKRKLSRKELEYRHLTLRGRLRLGAFLNPFYVGFVKFLCTFGISWKTWFERAIIECSYHIDDPQGIESLKGLWRIFIPGLHMIELYRLGRIVLQMEVQNHYRRTSPSLAFLLGVFPPLAVCYLQNAMNHHWALHVKHAKPLKKI